MSDEEEDDSTPLQDLRPFYRSQARQDLTFVKGGLVTSDPVVPAPTNRVADAYLSIVFKDKSGTDGSEKKSEEQFSQQPIHTDVNENKPDPSSLCPVCNLPLAGAPLGTKVVPHEASLAHQVCLTHSHPPSHLDREHMGLRYLASHGWDPDSRKGLGAEGSGIRAPIKAVEKKNTAGLGLAFNKGKKVPPACMETLDAGKIRKQHVQDRRKEAKLREMFYGDDKIAKYLGEEA